MTYTLKSKVKSLYIGNASVPITPDNPKGLALGGYGDRDDYCTGVHDDLFARISYFKWDKHADTQIILISLDLVGINSSVLNFFLNKISKQFSIQKEHILISCTHTHSGFESLGTLAPGILGGFGGILKSRLRTDVMIKIFKKVFKGIELAKNNLIRVKIGFKKLYLEDLIAFNRRKPQKPINKPINIMKFTDYAGNLVSIICCIGIHGTILKGNNSLISAEWMGVLVKELGSRLEENPLKYQNEKGVFVNFFIGAEGNVAPFTYTGLDFKNTDNLNIIYHKIRKLKAESRDILPNSNFEFMKAYGIFLASKIAEALDEIVCMQINEIRVIERRFYIPLYGIPRSNKIKDLLFYFKDIFLKKLFRFLFTMLHSVIVPLFNPIKYKKKYHIETSVKAIGFDEIIMLTSPGELFNEIEEEIYEYIREQIDPELEKKTFIIGFANDYASYLFPLEEYFKGGYENEFQFAPLAGALVKKEMKKAAIYIQNV
ncbi:MAG: hypothetical protein GF364_18265, partial [Candidatus Lokiarchaeota archaeon]|nr:hypothetical protein [Candidatus Lokiarchaeota archaeon]